MNAVITGATKGIGLAIAKKFIEKGNNICICSRSQEDLDKIERNLESLNSNCEVHIFKADLSKKSDVNQFADFSLEKFDKIDILVNNAGIYLGGQIMDEEEGNLEHMINTNLYSAYYLARRIGPQMIERKNGTIINIASIASFMAYPGGGSYSISKFAMRGLSMVLREELKDYGIKVTTIMPGATWSNSWAGVELPEERLMQASDIAEAVWSIFEMSPSAVIEEIILRPQLGDL